MEAKSRKGRYKRSEWKGVGGESFGSGKKGWLDGPFQFGEEGGLVTAEGPHLANPAFRFGAQQGEKLRAGGDLKRSRTRLKRRLTSRRGAILHLP